MNVRHCENGSRWQRDHCRGRSIVSVEVGGAIQEAEFDVGGGRPDKMISRVTEGEGGESGK